MGYQVPSVNQCYDFTCVIGQLQAWCCSHAPLVQSVYDECKGTSLSEQVAYLFGVVRDVVKAQQCVDENFKTLYDFVKDFFENLDLQEEVNNWMNQAFLDGSLEEILSKFTVPDWYNIVQHGAKNDASSDISDIVNTGLETYDIVYIPTGLYLLENTIVLNPGKTLIVEGKITYTGDKYGIHALGTYFNPSVVKGGSYQADNGTMFFVERKEKTWGGCLLLDDFVFTGKNFIRFITCYNSSITNGNVSFSNIAVDMLPVSTISETIPDNTLTNCNCFKNVHFEGQNNESTVFVRSTCSNNNVFYDCTFEKGFTGIQAYRGVNNEARGDCRSLTFQNCWFESLKMLATWKAVQNGLFIGYNNDRGRPYIFNSCIFQVIENFNDTNITAEGKSPLGFRSDIERIFVPGDYTDFNSLLPIVNNIAFNMNNLVISNADKSQTYDFGSCSPRYLRHIKNINATRFAGGRGTEFSFDILQAMYFGFYNELVNIFGKIYVCVKGTNSSGNFAFEFDLFRLDTTVTRVDNYHKITGTFTAPTITWEADNTCKMVFTDVFTSIRVHTVFVPMDVI